MKRGGKEGDGGEKEGRGKGEEMEGSGGREKRK